MDNKIIKSIQNQNDKAFEYIDKEYGQLIHYILYNLRLSHQDVEECYNDILLKLWTHLQSYDVCQASLKNYIALITRRTGLNYVRKNKRLYEEILYERMDIFESQTQGKKIDWDYIVEQLSFYERDLFYRYFYYFQTIESISLEKGKTYKSVESSIYRLRKKLKILLEKEVKKCE